MKTTIQTTRGGYKPFHHLRKLFILLTLTCLSCSAFAQNVKPYTVDLNQFPSSNDQRTVTFNRATKTFTVKGDPEDWNGIGIWPYGGLDISAYNVVRIKYRALSDCGFCFVLDYEDDAIVWQDKNSYCPSYLTEMVIPLIQGQKKVKGISFANAWNTYYEQFIVESITFEKVSNPVRTDIHASDEPPVIDTATTGNFDDKISSWDFVQKLGAGYNYPAFTAMSAEVDFGMDSFCTWGFSRPTKDAVLLFKNAGFKTLRLQTSPQVHMLDENYTIDPRFIKALKQFVDWAIEEDMYVIICGPSDEDMSKELYKNRYENDIHYAGYNVSEDYKASSEKFLTAMWKQYAQAFNNSYDEHLMFELLNEPIDCFHEHNFGREKTNCAVCKKNYTLMNEYNQLMVDAIRSTGGNNAKRFIILGGLSEDWKNITTNLFKMPKDKVKDRLIPTFHIYPLGFTEDPAKGGGKKYYTDIIRKSIVEIFAALDKAFFKKRIPVILTETNGGPLTNPVLERINCMKDMMAESTKKGRSCAVCVYWGEDYKNHRADFDPWNLKWNAQPEYLNTIIYGAQGKEYPLSEDFIKKNEVKIPSIVGKNLLPEPFEIKNWDASYRIDPELLVRSVPPKYKLEFTVEKTGPDAIMQIGYSDSKQVWRELVKQKNVRIQGASLKDGWCVAISKNCTFTLSIDENLAAALEASNGIVLNGQNIIIKSVKVVE